MGFFDIFFRKKTKQKSNYIKNKETDIIIKQNAEVYIKNVTDQYKSYLNDYFAFDIETTGLSPSNDRIVEIGVIHFENGIPTKQYSTLINSVEHISSRASKINHITDEMIANAPSEQYVFKKVLEFMVDAFNGKVPIVAHNASFDISFLKNTLERLGYSGNIKYIDTLALSKKKLDLINHKQSTIANHFEIEIKNTHRALDDAEVCGLIMNKLSTLDDFVRSKINRKNAYNNATKEFNTKESKITISTGGIDNRTLSERYGDDTVKKMYEKVENPSDEIMGLCAMVQKIIMCAGLNTNEIRFSQHQSITRCNIYYNFFAFKYGGNLSYMLVSEEAAKEKNLEYTPCSKKDLDHVAGICNNCKETYVRVKLKTTSDIEVFSDYIVSRYKKGYKWLQENRKYLDEYFDIYLSHNTNICDDMIEYYIQNFNQIFCEKEEKTLAKQKKKEESSLKSEQSTVKKNKKSNRKLQQLDDDGKLIAEYDILQRAIDATGINSKSIRDAANGKQKHAGGFVWKYVYLDDDEN